MKINLKKCRYRKMVIICKWIWKTFLRKKLNLPFLATVEIEQITVLDLIKKVPKCTLDNRRNQPVLDWILTNTSYKLTQAAKQLNPIDQNYKQVMFTKNPLLNWLKYSLLHLCGKLNLRCRSDLGAIKRHFRSNGVWMDQKVPSKLHRQTVRAQWLPSKIIWPPKLFFNKTPHLFSPRQFLLKAK